MGLGPTLKAMPNVHVLALHGEIDLDRKVATEAELHHLEGLDDAFVIIDLSDVTYIDTTLLNLLVKLQHHLAERSTETTVAIVAERNGNVGRVLGVTGFDTRFAIYDDMSAARKAAYLRLARPEHWHNAG